MSNADQSFDEAFGELYRSAYRSAHRVLGSVAEAEDAAAEAMARALVRWQRVGRLDHREAWVTRVAINVALDMARRRRSLPIALDPVTDPADAAALRLTLVAALDALPARQREVIALRYLAGLSEEEAASAMGISTNSTKKHASRAMARLRSQLRGDLGEEELGAI